MTGKQIITEWLESKVGQEINYGIIQKECPDYGFLRYGVYHTPESYTRYFRMVRDELKDLELVEVPKKWKTWEVSKELILF